MGRFLRYTVEKTLTGERETLKEYLIALEVYGKPSSYDPSVDSLVRVEASRLRTKLLDYYQAEGSADLVRLEFPKGSYAPVFKLHEALPILPMIPVVEAEGDGTQEDLRDALPTAPPPSHPSRHRLRWGVVLAIITAGVIGFFFRELSKPVAPFTSVAVLPFINLSPDPKATGAAAELTQDVQSAFARQGIWRVVSAPPVPSGSEVSHVEAAGRQPGVDTIFQGVITTQGNVVRVTAQLMTAGDGSHLWTGTYDRGPQNGSAERSAFADAILQSISAGRSEWTKKLTGQGPAGKEARELTYTARRLIKSDAKDHLGMRSAEQERPSRLSDLMAAIGGFEQAISLDPHYGPAYGGLAATYLLAATFDDRLSGKAREAAARALQVDETLSDAHFVIGYSKFLHDWDFVGARAALKRTLELDPRNITAYRLYADASVLTGDPESGFVALRHAQRLVPQSPVLAVQFGIMLYNTRRFEELAGYSRSVQERYPDTPTAHWLRGLSLEQDRNYSEARMAFEKCLQLSPDDARGLPALGHLFGISGQYSEALKIVDLARKRAMKGALGPFGIGLIYLGLNDRKSALEWLETALERHEGALPYLKVDPRWDAVRSDPAFAALLRKLSL